MSHLAAFHVHRILPGLCRRIRSIGDAGEIVSRPSGSRRGPRPPFKRPICHRNEMAFWDRQNRAPPNEQEVLDLSESKSIFLFFSNIRTASFDEPREGGGGAADLRPGTRRAIHPVFAPSICLSLALVSIIVRLHLPPPPPLEPSSIPCFCVSRPSGI